MIFTVCGCMSRGTLTRIRMTLQTQLFQSLDMQPEPYIAYPFLRIYMYFYRAFTHSLGLPPVSPASCCPHTCSIRPYIPQHVSTAHPTLYNISVFYPKFCTTALLIVKSRSTPLCLRRLRAGARRRAPIDCTHNFRPRRRASRLLILP